MAPSVLVLGGVGFAGRNFVQFLVENNLASSIRVVDKVLPQTAYLSKSVKTAFDNPNVEFLQGNLINPASIARVFTRQDGTEFDYVFNFAAETKYSQADEIYEERIYQLSTGCAREAAKRNVKVFVEFSSGEIYDSGKKPSTESDEFKPWTTIAKYKIKAIGELRKIPGLNLVVLRPGIIYGPGATSGITSRLIVGCIYQYLKEEMKFLYSKDLKINTVHVLDVSRAAWHVAEWYVSTGKTPGGLHAPSFNLVDKEDTDQETINTQLRTIFNIETGYYNAIISGYAHLNLKSVTEEINEKHVAPWAELLNQADIKSSPLTPYLDEELLYNNNLSMDGTLIERETGFEYQVPHVTTEKLVEVIDGFKELHLWP